MEKWEKIVLYGLHPTSRWGHCMVPFKKNKIIIFGGVTMSKYCDNNFSVCTFLPSKGIEIEGNKSQRKSTRVKNIVIKDLSGLSLEPLQSLYSRIKQYRVLSAQKIR